MFVPGVNGSIIANSNAPTSSRLKGAYKNSKKRKMPNGGLTYTPYSRVQNQYTDTPSPKPIVKPRVGDTITPNYTKLYTDLGVDAGSLLPGYIGKGFDVISKLRAAGDNDYNQGLEFVPGKKSNILSVTNDIQKIANAKPYIYKGRQMREGGEVEDHNDDKEMVEGVAGILRGVKDKKNRLQLANKMAKQFNREKVQYNLADFLKKSKVKK